MKQYIYIAISLIVLCGQAIIAEASPANFQKNQIWKFKKAIIKGSEISNTKQIVLAQYKHRRKSSRGARAHKRNPVINFRVGAPIFLPGYAPLSPRFSYYVNEAMYQRYPSHCSYLLGYSQKMTLPPGWAVNPFNSEVEFCRTAFYPTLPIENIPQAVPLPQPPVPVPAPTPQSSSFEMDSGTCRQLAYQAAEGGAGIDKTVEGGIMGGALGAAAGAAIGAVTGNPGKGAAIGAAAGGIGGATINNIEASQEYKTAFRNCMHNRGHEVLL